MWKRSGILEVSGPTSRRDCLKQIGLAGASITTLSVLAGCAGNGTGTGTVGNMDASILNAAVIAEALATTMYYNLIKGAIYKDLSGNAPDQAYLVAGFEQELNHYKTLVSLGGAPVKSGTNFDFPTGMFTNRQTTIDTLVTLEDTFIAAYEIGVRDFSSSGNRVVAAQIMGVECEHRVLGRVIANDLGLSYTIGLSLGQESVVPPSHTVNNLAYERTFTRSFPNMAAVVTALTPFLTGKGMGPTPYPFDSETTTLPAGIAPVILDDTTPS